MPCKAAASGCCALPGCSGHGGCDQGKRDSASRANAGLVCVLQLLGRAQGLLLQSDLLGGCQPPYHLLLSAGSLQATLPCSLLIARFPSDKMTCQRRTGG